MKGRWVFVLVAIAAGATSAAAQSLESSLRIAAEGGKVIGSSRACEIALPGEAMADFTRDHAIPGNTFDFIDAMNHAAHDAESAVGIMSADARTAHCSAMAELARAVGLLP